MLDFFDFDPVGTEGTRRTRIFTGLIGAVLGGALGYIYSGLGAATLPWLVYVVGGAAVGGFLGALFSFYVIIGVVVVVAVISVIAYQVMFGGS